MTNVDLFDSMVKFKQDMVSYISGFLKDGRFWIGNHTDNTNKIIDDRGEDYYVNSVFWKEVGQGYSKLYVTLSYLIYRWSEVEQKDLIDDIRTFECEFWQLSLVEQYKICSIVEFASYKSEEKNK